MVEQVHPFQTEKMVSTGKEELEALKQAVDAEQGDNNTLEG